MAGRIDMCPWITPKVEEQRFWASHTYRKAAQVLDHWYLVTTVLNSSAQIAMKWPFAQDPLAATGSIISAWFLVWVYLQVTWSKRAPEHYFKFRHSIMFCNRLMRIAALVLNCIAHRNLARRSAPSPSPSFPSAPSPPSASSTHLPLLPLACHLVISTGATIPLFHSIASPLPLLPHLTIQVLYLAVLVTLQQPVALTLLNQSSDHQHAPALCHGMNEVLGFAFGLLTGMPPATTSILTTTCDQRATHALILFAQVYCGGAIPAYIAYRIERHLKVKYIRQELRAAGTAVAACPRLHLDDIAEPGVTWDAVAMGVLGIMSWALVHCFLDQLISLARPL